MRRALLAVSATIAGALVAPGLLAAPQTSGTALDGAVRYHDPALAGRATTALTGTLTPVEAEGARGERHLYGIATADGRWVPVSLDRLHAPIESPVAFSGRITAASAGRPYAVQSASIASESDTRPAASSSAAPMRTAAARSSSAHRLYVAVVTNRGKLAARATIAKQVDAMRSYWKTEANGLISSFTQSGSTVYYASSAATRNNGCGLGDPSPLWNEAGRRFRGVNFSAAGNHLMVVVPESCNGAYGAGVATVGDSLRSGGRTVVSLGTAGVQVGVHELGHNFSLQHANVERCGSRCTTEGYLDLYSIMGLVVSGGNWTPPALDSAYRVQLGIAPTSEVPTVTRSATVRLTGRGTGSGRRGFVIAIPGSRTRYVVDFRSGTGRDNTSFYEPGRSVVSYRYRTGVVVQRLEGSHETTLMTRRSGNSYLTALTAGTSFVRGSLKIAVTKVSASGADVKVTLPAQPAPKPTPKASATSASPTPSQDPPSESVPLPSVPGEPAAR